MSGTRAPSPEGPATHHEFFAGLRDAGVAYLLTGAAALVLHGVPRLSEDLDLLAAPDGTNLARLERLLAAWGYGKSAREGGAVQVEVRRFRHPASALGEVDVVLLPPGEFERLHAGRGSASLVDLEIPLVGPQDLRAHKARSERDVDREDAAGLALLAAMRQGREAPGDASGDPTRREQIAKFSRWSVPARLDWLLSTARLSRGLAPEARPMTRRLTRRHGWGGGRR